MPKGSPPRDEKFLEIVKAMQEDGFLAYELPDPKARIRGLSQHPLQKVVRNYGESSGKKFHTFKWLDKVYVVRLPCPDENARNMRVPTYGAHAENQPRTDAHDDGTRGVDARDVRPSGSGSSDSTRSETD